MYSEEENDTLDYIQEDDEEGGDDADYSEDPELIYEHSDEED